MDTTFGCGFEQYDATYLHKINLSNSGTVCSDKQGRHLKLTYAYLSLLFTTGDDSDKSVPVE